MSPRSALAAIAPLVPFALLAGGGCEDGGPGPGPGPGNPSCGPSEAVVARVIDGDTIELAGGTRIRYLMVNAPETTGGKNDCYGSNAVTFNTDLVAGKTVTLSYDVECRDPYDRTLAYVRVNGQEVNSLMIERGYGCLLRIPPNGEERADEFEALEDAARAANRGLWGACDPIPCN